MKTYIVNDIDGDAVQQIAQGTVDQLAKVFAENHHVLAAIGRAAANGEATASYMIDGETYTTTVVEAK